MGLKARGFHRREFSGMSGTNPRPTRNPSFSLRLRRRETRCYLGPIGFSWITIQLTPNLSRNCPKRWAKELHFVAMGMKTSPPL